MMGRSALLAATNSGLPWSPRDIQAALWLDASDSSTLTITSGNVSQWNDKSGNNRHGTQSSYSNMPTRNVTGINGKASLSFDGSSDFLNFPTGFLHLETAFTIAMVMSGPLQNNDSIWGPTSSFLTGLELVYTGTASLPTLLRINSVNKITTGLWSTNSAPTITIITASPTATAGWLNGNTVSAVSSTGITPLNYNGIYSMGRYGGEGFYVDMQMGEFVILASSASQGDREKLEGYLAHKWGLTGSLPNNHPYKTVGPTN